MNKVILIGNVTKDIEAKATQSGKNYCSFTLALNRGKDKADFAPCIAWDKASELITKYVSKGDKLAVEGRYTTDNYTNKEGKNITRTYVTVERTEFLSKSKKASDEQQVDQQKTADIKKELDKPAEEAKDPFADFGNNLNVDDDFLE